MKTTPELKTVMLMLTAKCSNHCAFCLNINNIPMARRELDTGEWCSVLDDLRNNTTATDLVFVEREVFDKPGCVSLIEAAGQRGFKLQVCTGGSDKLTPTVAKRCVPWINHLVVSFHGLASVLSQKTFERQMKLLELVRDIFLPSEISVTVTTTVTRKHADKLESITDQIAQLLGREKHFYEHGGQLFIRYQTPDLPAGQRETPVFQNFVQPCLQGGMLTYLHELGWTAEKNRSLFSDDEWRLISSHRCSREPEQILAHSFTPNGRPCGLEADGDSGAAGFNRMTIRWDGEVVPCASSYRFSYGSILDTGAARMWQQAYQSMRQPEIVNAYTIWRAFGEEGHCCYGQDAAYTVDQEEEKIFNACLPFEQEWREKAIARKEK